MPLGTNTKRYETPNHPFQGGRIAEEHELLGRYGLKNKEELWRAQSELRGYRREARELLGRAGGDVRESGALASQPEAAASGAADAAAREGEEFVARLRRIGVLGADDGLDDVLSLEVTDLLERRLQTLVYRQGLANTVAQARQFIVHGHVTVDGRRVTVPSDKIDVGKEDAIAFDAGSPLADELHPERAEGQE